MNNLIESATDLEENKVPVLEYKKSAKTILEKVDFEKKYSVKNNKNSENYIFRLINKYKNHNNIVVMLDGQVVFKKSDNDFLGVTITSFTAEDYVNRSFDKRLSTYLSSESTDRMEQLLKANLNSAILIDINDVVTLSPPLLIVICGLGDVSHITMINSAKNSAIKIIEKTENASKIYMNVLRQINMGENSQLEYVRIEKVNKTCFINSSIMASLKADATLKLSYADLNDCSIYSDTQINLIGENATAETKNIIFADGQDKHLHFTLIEHSAKHTAGHILNHAVAKDFSEVYLEGVGKINKGMSGSNSDQHSEIITLSDTVTVKANPYLIIDEYDVKAGHGAAVGQLEDDQLYYLMSRGLPKPEAQRLIITGFVQPVADNICINELKTEFERLVQQKLEN